MYKLGNLAKYFILANAQTQSCDKQHPLKYNFCY